jgi:hypothetical protein
VQLTGAGALQQVRCIDHATIKQQGRSNKQQGTSNKEDF